jgi:hypothetical protein
MMKLTRVWIVCAIVGVLVRMEASAEPLTKRGTFSGAYGWYANTVEAANLGKDHAIWAGVSSGSFRNDAGSGFLHAAILKCTFSGEWRSNAGTRASGDCIITDRDGDQISLAWKCTAHCSAKDQWPGEFQWTNGTGKYSGAKGRGTFVHTNAGPLDRPVITGFSTWKGEWELP